ncbi:cytochrome c oxidase subunit II [Rhodothermus profundi]|nr:cytochrome c oxidase subunit II [Rhodothermus profundi]
MQAMILLQSTAWLPEAASSVAPEVDSLFQFWALVSTVIFIGVVGAMTFFVVRYRRRRRDEVPEPVKEKKVVELAWIVVPTILVLIVFTWGFRVFIKMYTAPPDAYEIVVYGYQWYWEFEYPNGVKTTNELHVPAGQPVKLRMTSVDVIHSFYVPAFRVKQDVLPDRYSSLWFEATKPGEYTVFCAEYCGTQHSGMLAKVIVHPREEFEQWLESAGIPEDMPLAELGARLYREKACFSCHSIDGSRLVGPTFKGLFGSTRTFEDGSTAVADENYLREAILQPGARVVQGYPNVMPASYASLSEREVAALIEFIKQQQ